MFNQKLRLWDTETKQMIYPKEPVEIQNNGDADKLGYEDYAITLNGNILMKDDADWSHTYRMLSDKYAKPLIIMRSIGLLDNKGIDIYEGDICQCNFNGSIDIICIVEWDKSILGFVFYHRNYGHLVRYEINDRKIKIIGNKYENPELLGE